MRLLSTREREVLARVAGNDVDTVDALESMTVPALLLLRDAVYDLHRLTSDMVSRRQKAEAERELREGEGAKT